MNEGELKNRRIIVKNAEDGTVLADTVIHRFNRDSNSVTIRADSLLEKRFCNISAMVFLDKCLYEFRGSIRGAVIENEVEVFLGKSKEKENRTRIRYPISLEGDIKGILIDTKEISLNRYIHIKTINMSASGVLLRADVGYFSIGEIFSLVLKMQEGMLEMRCEIVRIQSVKGAKSLQDIKNNAVCAANTKQQNKSLGIRFGLDTLKSDRSMAGGMEGESEDAMLQEEYGCRIWEAYFKPGKGQK